MEAIKRVKERGNAAFRALSYKDAITFYEEALMQTKFRKSDITKEEPSLTIDEAEQVSREKAELETIH